VDLDPAAGEESLDALVRDLERPDAEDQLAFRAGRRYTARLVSKEQPAATPAALRADRSYLVTGGLGPLGRRVAGGLVERGARYLVLAQRSAATAEAMAWIGEIEARGARVWCRRTDVASAAEVAALLDGIADTKMPPLAGVVHAAGVLEDGVLAQQDVAHLRRALASKADGAWHLHAAIGGADLDFFVLFSSAAALLGAAGQGPYAAANAALDALAHHRRALRLPALAIAWGAWTGGGMASRLAARHRRRLADLGLGAIHPEAGVDLLLRHLVGSDAAHLAVLPMDWMALRSRLPAAAVPPVYREVLAPEPAGGARPAERCLAGYLHEQAAAILGLAVEQLEADQPLGTQGLDSLMSVELRNRVLADLRITLPVASLLQNPSIVQLAEELRALGFKGFDAAAGETACGIPGCSRSAPVPAWSPVVLIRGGGCRPPLFCVHPWAGVVFPYFDLARELGSDQPFYGLQAAGLHGEPDRTVEAMAERYVEAVLATAPGPPYRLGGWSFGAPVAFEMAQRLRRRGAVVDRLLLLDPPKPDPTLVDWLEFTFTVALLHIWPYLVDYLRIAAAGRRDDLGAAAAPAPAARPALLRALRAELASLRSREAMVRRIMRIVNLNSRAIRAYRPRPYPGPVTVFRMRDQVKTSELDLSAGWSRYAADLDVQIVPGHHLQFLRQPHVREIAGRLRPYLEETR
jgi:thioesterase domain-containing protein/NADP-dependent 3-hydroxy acid dehydrogenase YdfG/aryl carrier-like protein